ncbi:MAG TPA: HAD-IIIA family hydrolase [Kofleriaceae bacterium]|nr:HAD-IIIA family hydrolase [Kofleriaceae bacterium]
MSRRALFLDRDGTLIVDVGYPRDPDQVELLPGAAAALRALPADIALVIVTNQSGLARGLITPAEAAAVADRVAARFAAEGVRLAGAYVCPHGPDDGCSCRKPAPGLLLQAAHELGLDLAASVMIGDKPSDVAAGRAAGCAASLRLASAPEPDTDEAVVGWPAAGRRIASVFGVE